MADRPLFLPSRRGILRQYSTTLQWMRQAVDVAVVLVAFYVISLIKLGGAFPATYQVLTAVIALVMVVIYQWSGVYRPLRLASIWLEARGLFKAWLGVLLALFTLGFATKTGHLFSREALFFWAILGYLAQLGCHGLLLAGLRTLRERGYNLHRVVLVGSGEAAAQFAQRLTRNPWLGVEVVGYVADGPPAADPPGEAPLRWLGPRDALAEVIGRHDVDTVYITLPLAESNFIGEVMRQLMPLTVEIHWVPDMSAFHVISHSVREIEGQPVLSLSESPVSGPARIGKWLEDKILATLVLVVFSPLMALLAVLVKLDSPGPALFKQQRAGLNGKPINVYKFRTMRVHEEPPGQLTQAHRADPRVTRLGAFLRATSLDELPQFYNVLQGRMSIVGPRPHALEHDDYYQQQIDAYMLRYRIKPGITGWAQVNGYRGETDRIEKMTNRVKYDLFYINNWSLWFDLLVIVLTVWVVVTGRNAY